MPSSNTEAAEAVMAGTDRLLTPGQVAEMFKVDPKTVTRYAQAGRLPSTRTPGGHRRFLESDVREALKNGFAAA